MDSVSVLILEDDTAESDPLVALLQEHGYTVAGVATSAAGALALLYENRVDVIVIDIFLNGSPEGISFAESINTIPDAARPFVFLTSSADRRIFDRAKLTHPFSFLVKPFNRLELLYAIEMAVEKFYSQAGVFNTKAADTVIGDAALFIKKKEALKKVSLNTIIYIEVEERYCNIITEQEKFVILISLTKITALLHPEKFVRTHRNYIVNTEKITEIIVADNLIKLTGNHQVPFTDKYREFMNRFTILR